MHVLVTADTLTGTWTYARELVTGLVSRGVKVTFVSFGEIPLPSQTVWMEGLSGLDYRPTAFRLEWMQDSEFDLEDSSNYLQSLVKEVKPDLLHLSQYCYGALPVDVPRLVVAHGDMVSWWMAVHGREPNDTRWFRWYRRTITDGVARASAVVAPSQVMLDGLRAHFASPQRSAVIYNGRNPVYFNPYVTKDDWILSVGRLLDAGKQVSLLTQHAHSLPVCIVGGDKTWESPALPIRADVKVRTGKLDVALKGPQTESQMRTLYSRASIYAATSRYEAFGMSALEAALSRCAIVANDIPVFREIWGDTAVYFRTNDADSLADTLRRLGNDRDQTRTYGNLAYQRARACFTAKRMLDEYLQLYRSLLHARTAAA